MNVIYLLVFLLPSEAAGRTIGDFKTFAECDQVRYELNSVKSRDGSGFVKTMCVKVNK